MAPAWVVYVQGGSTVFDVTRIEANTWTDALGIAHTTASAEVAQFRVRGIEPVIGIRREDIAPPDTTSRERVMLAYGQHEALRQATHVARLARAFDARKKRNKRDDGGGDDNLR